MIVVAALAFATMAYDLKHNAGALGFVAMMVGILCVTALLVYLAMPPWLLRCRKIEDDQLWIEPLNSKVKDSFTIAVRSNV
jgi:hypothetical protein